MRNRKLGSGVICQRALKQTDFKQKGVKQGLNAFGEKPVRTSLCLPQITHRLKQHLHGQKLEKWSRHVSTV